MAEGASWRAAAWTPVRNGGVYCSPACGYGCAWGAFERATAEAKALADLMGHGWEPHVWDNGGWQYEVTKATARIMVVMKAGGMLRGNWEVVRYQAWLGSSGRFICDAETPEDALGFAVQEYRSAILRMEHELADLIE